MELEKTRNSINGFLMGILCEGVGTILPFILRTAMIYAMGIDYAGINSLFSSIISILELANLGFASAVIYSMYKPIRDNDREKLCQLLGYFRKIYVYVGLIILLGGLCVLPFLNEIVTSEIPGGMNLQILYLCFVFKASITYFFGGYRSAVLLSYQRNDIISVITAAVVFIGYSLQIAGILIFRNYYLYVALMILIELAMNLTVAAAAKKMFPEINPRSGLDPESRHVIFSKVKDLIYKNIGYTLSTSLDSVVISRFLGLTEVAKYGNYSFVFFAAYRIMLTFFKPLTAGIGNKILNSSKEEVIEVYRRLTSLSGIYIAFCCSCLLCMYQPFMNLWMGPELMYPIVIPVLMTMYFFVCGSEVMVETFKDALGMWHEDRWKSIVGAGVNLVLNIVLVQHIGVAGVILSTVISLLFIEIPWGAHVLYKNYFQYSVAEYYGFLFRNIFQTAAVCGLTLFLTTRFTFSNSLVNLVICTVITVITTAGLLVLFNCRNDNFSYLISAVKRHFIRN